MSFETLLGYYQQSRFNPVPISLETPQAWHAHCARRRNLYERHLSIPLALIRDKTVLEFGCNTGENSLVLASLGAKLTLVEPNEQAHEALYCNFKRFHLESQIAQVVPASINEFQSSDQFDLVIAEGFLYTLPNRDSMLQKVCSFVKPGLLGVVSFNDVCGCFLEMLRRAVLRRSCQLSGIADWGSERGLSIAEELFLEDFRALPASRPFQAWWKDTLVNPFLAYDFLWDYHRIIPLLGSVDCHFWACSPKWVMTDAFAWYKSVSDLSARAQELLTSWPEKLTYFLFGHPFSTSRVSSPEPVIIGEVYRLVREWSDFSLTQGTHPSSMLLPDRLYAFLEQNQDERIQRLCRELRQVSLAMQQDSMDMLRVAYHNANELRRSWGAAYHYLAFQKS